MAGKQRKREIATGQLTLNQIKVERIVLLDMGALPCHVLPEHIPSRQPLATGVLICNSLLIWEYSVIGTALPTDRDRHWPPGNGAAN